jgi:hypothetical protein
LQVQKVLQTFDVVNINISALGLPLQCLGLRGYGDHLTVTILASRMYTK